MFDYTEIQKDFNKVLCHSQDQESVNTDSLFKKWYEKKSAFIERMGGLIYEAPGEVTFSLSKSAIDEKIEKFLDSVYNISDDIGNFLSTEGDGLLDNKVISTYNYHGDLITVGMRIGRALHKYFKECCSEDQLEWIIQTLSMIIQENTVHGKLCLSVHPLDFLSLSENNHAWRSCHALDGEYRDGNLSYMCDDVTIIAYLKSDEDTILPAFTKEVPWNNKKWRCLMFFDQGRKCVWAGRQYPFTSTDALDQVATKLFQPMRYFASGYVYQYVPDWSYITFRNAVPKFTENSTGIHTLRVPHIFIDNSIYPLTKFIKDGKHSNAYNDLLNSHFYTPAVLLYGFRNFLDESIPPLEVGGEAPCIHCGKGHSYDSSTMLCKDDVLIYSNDEIEGVSCCPNCGDRFFDEDGIYFQGELYCADCYDNMDIISCPNCGEEFCGDEGYWDMKSELTYCSKYCCDEHNRLKF